MLLPVESSSQLSEPHTKLWAVKISGQRSRKQHFICCLISFTLTLKRTVKHHQQCTVQWIILYDQDLTSGLHLALTIAFSPSKYQLCFSLEVLVFPLFLLSAYENILISITLEQKPVLEENILDSVVQRAKVACWSSQPHKRSWLTDWWFLDESTSGCLWPCQSLAPVSHRAVTALTALPLALVAALWVSFRSVCHSLSLP